MMYAFILLFILSFTTGYAGCKGDHNAGSIQQVRVDQQQSDSLQTKKIPEMPVVAVKIAPIYPEEARKKGIQGEVQVQIVVGVDGTVKEATVIKNETGSKDLEQAALDAVKKWKFDPPGKLDGKPVEVNVIIPIKFKLQDEKK